MITSKSEMIERRHKIPVAIIFIKTTVQKTTTRILPYFHHIPVIREKLEHDVLMNYSTMENLQILEQISRYMPLLILESRSTAQSEEYLVIIPK